MEESNRKSLHQILDIVKRSSNMSDEWADYTEDQLYESANSYRNAAVQMKRYLELLKGLYQDRFGALPEVSEEELRLGRGVENAHQYIMQEMKNPFVLDPPKGFFARKPGKVDYIECGRSLQILGYYYASVASKQEMYARQLYYDLPGDVKTWSRMVSECRENDVTDADHYKKYERPDGTSSLIYFGDIRQSIDISEYDSKAVKRVLTILEENGIAKRGEMHIPCTFDAEKPFNLFINYTYSLDSPENEKNPANLLHNLVYQIIRALPAYSYQFIYMDPSGAGNSLGELQGLTSVRDGNAYWLFEGLFHNLYVQFEVINNKESFQSKLSDLITKVGNINTIRGSKSSVGEYNKPMFHKNGSCKEDAQLIPRQFIFIENIHKILSEDTLQKIETLVSNADKCGISLVIVSGRNSMERMDDLERMLSRNQRVNVIDWSMEGATLSTMLPMLGEERKGTFRYVFTPENTSVSYPQYIQSVIEEMKPKLDMTTKFNELFDIDKEWGTRDATDGLHIPVGVNERGNIVEIELGGSLSNALLAGTIGCGKSTFLHNICNCCLMYYRPEDLEIWLSDYKTVEFLRYTKNTPANITYVGVAKTKEYSLAFIDKIYNEYMRRQGLFGAEQAITSLSEYRKKYGTNSMPRLLIIVDEFHYMSEHIQDEPEYATRLGNILREARAFGMNLLLSDQTCGVGLRGLKDEARLQLNCRLGMRTTNDEYNAVFNISNAAEVIPKVLDYETVIKRETTRTDVNGIKKNVTFYEHVKNIHITPEMRDIIAAKSIECYGENNRLSVIKGNLRAPADWDEIMEGNKTNPLRRGFGLFPGIPKNLKSFFRVTMFDEYNENLMSIGKNDILQTELLVHLAESVCKLQKTNKIIFIVSENDYIFQTAETWIRDFCSKQIEAELLTDSEDICRCISEQVDEIVRRRHRKNITNRVFLFWLGMPGLCRDMYHYPSEKPEKLIKGTKGTVGKNGSSTDLHKELDEMFNRLFGDSPEQMHRTQIVEDEFEDAGLLYNATDDIQVILDEGARRGIHSLVFNLTVNESKRIKCAKYEYFGHKIAFRMSKEDAMDFLGSSTYIVTSEKKIIDEETAVYFDGKSSVHFVPFIDSQIEVV